MSETARAFWSLEVLAGLAGGRWLGDGELAVDAAGSARLGGVSIDSRTIAAGQVFVAIRGERFDGHEFLSAAAERGAGMLIVDDPTRAGVVEAAGRVPTLAVDDARRTLGVLASAYRDRLDALVIGITGSNGKTSTVRMIDAVFRGAAWRTTSAIKSFNNDIGLPLTVLNAPPDAQALVCEIGMNNPGEIAALGAMVRPNVAVVTSIGRAHVGRLGSVGAIAREKLSLLRFVRDWQPKNQAHRPETWPTKTPAAKESAGSKGLALVPALGTEPAVVDLALDELNEAGVLRGLDLRRMRAGDGHGVRWRIVEAGDAGVSFTVEDDAFPNARVQTPTVFRVPMFGAVMAGNAALAVTVGRWAGLDDATIARGLAGTIGAEGRMTASTHQRDGATVRVLDDCYNASPESMLAALIETARQADDIDAARVLILGAMGEMGEHEEHAHREIGRALVERRLIAPGDAVLGVGEPARWIIEEVKPATGVECAWFAGINDDLHNAVERSIRRAIDSRRPNGPARVLVLIKGSRSVGLERVAASLTRS